MIQHIQLAAVLTEGVGAVILGKALAFESVDLYIKGEGTAKWEYDTYADVARARASAESLAGLTLVGAGLIGQAAIASGVSDPGGALKVLPYAAAVAAVALVWMWLLPSEIRRRVTRMLRVRMEASK